MSPIKEKFLSVPSLYQILVIIATVITVAVGFEARIAGQVDRAYVNKVDYVRAHEDLRQQIMVMQQMLKSIQEDLRAIRHGK